MVALAAVLAAGACRSALPHSQPSSDALAREVLAAVQERDLARLDQLALSESEFREVIWPELPAARPEHNLTPDYVWHDTHLKSRVGQQQIVAGHGGEPLTFVRLEFRGDTTQHRSFLIRRDAVVVVRDGEGTERQLRLFGSIVERSGGFKVYSYNVD